MYNIHETHREYTKKMMKNDERIYINQFRWQQYVKNITPTN